MLSAKFIKLLCKAAPKTCITRGTSSIAHEKDIKESYKALNLPLDSSHDQVRNAFLELAKKYHPDSGSPLADIEKFVQVEKAFRTLTKYITGKSNSEEIESIIYDIQHTAPQHRQYLSYEGVGHGTPFEREKQYRAVRAQKAAENVMEHRINKSLATDKALMKKGVYFSKKHEIKTKYGFDRLVEDLIQESMTKGEFDNLSGKGKPLKHDTTNPYVDFTTYKINQVLIDNGFTPEWISLNKDIEFEIDAIKTKVTSERKKFGPYPLQGSHLSAWEKFCEEHRPFAQNVNSKINKYNLVVPLLNKQKVHLNYDKLCEETLKNGIHSVYKDGYEKVPPKDIPKMRDSTSQNDLFDTFFRAIAEIFTFKNNRKSNT